jgi:hypothetical protein
MMVNFSPPWSLEGRLMATSGEREIDQRKKNEETKRIESFKRLSVFSE